MSSAGFVQWAHQGGAGEEPANTVRAMRRALRKPTDGIGIELDVHRSRDGRLVVIHDKTVERTTNGHGRVRRHEQPLIWTLNADDRDPPRPATHVPTFEEILAAWRKVSPPPPMTVEIKARDAVRPLVDALEQCSDDERSAITVTSFRDTILWSVRRRLARRGRRDLVNLSPGGAYMFGFWICAALGVPRRRSRYARIQIPVKKGLTFATPRLVGLAQQIAVKPRFRTPGGPERMQVDVWTIDDPETMRQLIGLGVNGIMTDRPTVLREVLAAG